MWLLEAPSDVAAEAYLRQVVSQCGGDGVEVRLNAGPNRGKGVFTTKSFSRGDLLWKEAPLVGLQHGHNKAEALVCAHCFCWVGSVEQQIARKLLHDMERCKELQQRKQARGDGSAGPSSSTAHQAEGEEEEEDTEEEDEVAERMDLIAAAGIEEGYLRRLMSGEAVLPHSDHVPLAKPVSCQRGCGEVYCSTRCMEQAWEKHHCLLCCGGSAARDEGGGAGSSHGGGSALAQETVCGLQVCRQYIPAFLEHARATNEIFELAAKVVAMTLTAYSRGGGEEACARQAGEGGSSSEEPSQRHRDAWLPFMMGWKQVWWECVAVPEDVDEEESFREQLKALASESLECLSKVLPNADEVFPGLLSLHVYGEIVGMFELNNLALSVPSPVEDFFLHVDGLPDGEKEAAEKVTQPLLDALDKTYDKPAEGTAFYALQSCANHSCVPSAVAEGEPTGEVSLLALCDVQPGKELTISYIDMDEEGKPMGFRERRRMLKDYGFECDCELCGKQRAQRAAAKAKGKRGMAVRR